MKKLLLISSLYLAVAGHVSAARLTSFADDFNRATPGANYAAVRGAAYGISDGVLTNGGPGQNHVYLKPAGELTTLPTAEDYANGYSFAAALDIFIPASGQASVVTAGLALNEQDGQRGLKHRLLRFRGHGPKSCSIQLLGGNGLEGVNMGELKSNAWHTLKVSSAAPGVYQYTFGRRGEARPLASGTFTETTTNILTGGYIGIYTENAPAGAYQFDNFSVTVKKDERTTAQELLLFSDQSDIADTWGKIHFSVTPLRENIPCKDPGFSVTYSIPQNNGSCLVYGSVFHQDPDITSKKLGDSGADMARAKSTWDIVRATTRDGVSFENVETVFTSAPANWSVHCTIAAKPDGKEFLLLRLLANNNGFGYYPFSSPDGKNWKQLSTEPLFYDGDAMSVFWSPKAQRYIAVCKTLQPFPKHITTGHGGRSKLLNNDKLRDRRVLSIRSSPDGIKWTPSDSMDDVWDRSGRKKAIPAEFMTMPDADDAPDLEFYSGNGFWYYDRAYLMLLNYADSPLVKGHGPHLDTEWWVGSDGLHWNRPARDVNATGDFIKRISHNPLILGGKFLFHYGNFLLAMKQDRISYVGARANAEFSTKPFPMPKGDLLLNAAAPAPERAFATQQAYIMVAVLDENGTVIPGFEADKCVIKSADEIDLPLFWGDKSARELAGRKISLRFQLRSANIYAVAFKE
ncbi:MAG: hypothetical protein NTZ16_04310 [Verrucomicrobia bacterium]|nr:hypothetical protein [Verrucomicrobiota bacterium]